MWKENGSLLENLYKCVLRLLQLEELDLLGVLLVSLTFDPFAWPWIFNFAEHVIINYLLDGLPFIVLNVFSAEWSIIDWPW